MSEKDNETLWDCLKPLMWEILERVIVPWIAIVMFGMFVGLGLGESAFIATVAYLIIK